MKRIIVVCDQPLLGHGIESVLCGCAGLEIADRVKDAATAIERIRELQPDVVVLASSASASAAPQILQVVRLAATVIELNTRDNTLYIYRAAQRVVRSTSDLLAAILDGDTPPQSRG